MHDDATPLFSIITVTWNAAKTIGATVKSVATQSFGDYEYIVIDGASSDDTLSLVKQAGIANTRILSERDNGLYDAMNKGIAMARGTYLIFLNAGDAFSTDDTLSRLSQAAANEPDVIYGQTQLVNQERKVVGKRHLTAPVELNSASFKRGMVVCHQAFVARREIVDNYDLGYRFSADYDWCIKVLKKSKCNAYVGDEPIIDYLNEGITTANHKASLRERYAIMRKHYGTFTAITRHMGFVPRYIWRKITTK